MKEEKTESNFMQDVLALRRCVFGTSSKRSEKHENTIYERILAHTVQVGISLPLRKEGEDMSVRPENFDPVEWPAHYNTHPSGIEPITITKHMSFCLGNVIKYVMRADLKGKPIEDLKKAREYLDYEIQLREEQQCQTEK